MGFDIILGGTCARKRVSLGCVMVCITKKPQFSEDTFNAHNSVKLLRFWNSFFGRSLSAVHPCSGLLLFPGRTCWQTHEVFESILNRFSHSLNSACFSRYLPHKMLLLLEYPRTHKFVLGVPHTHELFRTFTIVCLLAIVT
jgi:hypothetical protein